MSTTSQYLTKTFWVNTGERVIRTAAVTALGTFITDKTGTSIDWGGGLQVVGISALGTLLLCLAARTTGDAESPSFLLTAPRRVKPVKR